MCVRVALLESPPPPPTATPFSVRFVNVTASGLIHRSQCSQYTSVHQNSNKDSCAFSRGNRRICPSRQQKPNVIIHFVCAGGGWIPFAVVSFFLPFLSTNGKKKNSGIKDSSMKAESSSFFFELTEFVEAWTGVRSNFRTISMALNGSTLRFDRRNLSFIRITTPLLGQELVYYY